MLRAGAANSARRLVLTQAPASLTIASTPWSPIRLSFRAISSSSRIFAHQSGTTVNNMAPPPRMLTPPEVQERLGITIANDELAYVEGQALVVFQHDSSEKETVSGKSKGKQKSENPGNGVGSIVLLGEGQGPGAEAFLNPVQEFNRDLSICAITTFERDMNAERLDRRVRGWYRKQAKLRERDAKEGESSRKRLKLNEEGDSKEGDNEQQGPGQAEEGSKGAPLKPPHFPMQRITILEALAATGLRSIRYAKEIENVKYILANDISTSAIAAMRRNVELNFPPDKPVVDFKSIKNRTKEEAPGAGTSKQEVAKEPAEEREEEHEHEAPANERTKGGKSSEKDAPKSKIHPKCRIKINEGDALGVMYSHRSPTPGGQFDVIDLDPYGSASMFLDGAVQSVAEGGLLLITCTDLAVLAGGQYPEKSFSLYGGTALRAEYSHEIALRLVLHAIASNAAKYGRYIQPVLSLSIDFYVRVFVRVWTSQVQVKKLASQTATIWGCQGCGNNAILPMGRIRPGPPSRDGTQQWKYSAAGGPPVGNKCDQCGGSFMMGGPMWAGPLHDTGFCERLLDVVNEEPSRFRTADRIRGMVSTAAQELGNTHAPTPGSEEAFNAEKNREVDGTTANSASAGSGKMNGKSGKADEAEAEAFKFNPCLDSMFYFTPSKISGAFHTNCAPLSTFVNGLLNAGYQVSRSHCTAGSLKTDCPRSGVMDLHRNFVKQTQREEAAKRRAAEAPVSGAKSQKVDVEADEDEAMNSNGLSGQQTTETKEDEEDEDPRRLKLSKRIQKMSEHSPAFILNSRPIEHLFDITTVHPEADKILVAGDLVPGASSQAKGNGKNAAEGEAMDASDDGSGTDGQKKQGKQKKKKLVRYPANPTANWGPGTAAKTVRAQPQKNASSAADAKQ